jgi:hypothetical protein
MKYVGIMVLIVLSTTVHAQDIITLDESFEIGDRLTFTALGKKYKNVKVTTVSDSTIWVTWDETYWDGGTVKKVNLVEIQIEDFDQVVSRLYNNSVYFEFFGNGLFWSANYEHLFALSEARRIQFFLHISVMMNTRFMQYFLWSCLWYVFGPEVLSWE